MRRRGRNDRPLYQITGARRGLNDDVARRQVRYAISMGIRTVCFVLAIFSNGWLRAVFLVAAIGLPYLAVVYANSGREPAQGTPPGFRADEPPELPSNHKQIDSAPDRDTPVTG